MKRIIVTLIALITLLAPTLMESQKTLLLDN